MAEHREDARSERRAGSAQGAAVGRILVALALLAVGLCLGIVLGSLAEGPRLFVRRLTQPIQRVELAPEPGMDAAPLTAFRELQAKQASKVEPPPTAPEEPPLAPAPAPVAAAPPGPAKPAAPDPQPAERARPDTPEQRAAELVIAKLRAPSQSPSAAQAPSGKVIQVAAYTDERSANALARRLTGDGYNSYVSPTLHGGVNRYRVRVRPKQERDLAALTERLKAKGLSVWVTQE